MNPILRYGLALPGLLFLVMGLAWLVAPGLVAPQVGMVPLEGSALSTQIGDLTAIFVTLGVCIGLGVITDRRFWFYPPAMLLGLAAFGRVVAWGVHGAALSWDSIAVEVVVAVLLLVATRTGKGQGAG